MRKQDLKRVSDFVWEVPTTYRADMRVPARLYASDALLEAALEDESVEQLVNTATLPGLVGHALAMPDIHQGYGFPIGGVVASSTKDGVISPGGVGYDINCLSGDSRVLHALGYTRSIEEMAEDWHTERVVCQDFQQQSEAETSIVRYLHQAPSAPVYKIITEAGDEITATADHPFWTPDGMIELGKLEPGDLVAIRPFAGVPYEKPPVQIIVDESDIEREMAKYGKGTAGNAAGQIMNQLRRRGILPLRPTSPEFPYLLKIAGFVLGDGSILFVGKDDKGVTWFYGKPEDLEAIRRDVQQIGFTPSRIYTRERLHRIATLYGVSEFSTVEASFKVMGSAFALLLAALGVPVGNKAAQDYRLPDWIFDLPHWQQRLFLASFFGAELMSPRGYKANNKNFPMPMLGINKREDFTESGRLFLQDVASILSNLGIKTGEITQEHNYTNKHGVKSYRLRLLIRSVPKNLYALWSRVGFEYNARKRHLAAVATQYLKLKMQALKQRASAAQSAYALNREGVPQAEIVAQLAGVHTHAGFVEHSLYRDPTRKIRVGDRFPTLEEYQQDFTDDLGETGLVWERISHIEPVQGVDTVYDFTVAHPDHNFVANGFVVSNCGVRVLASALDADQLEPHLSNLATALYRNCPSGVGSGGGIDLNAQEFDKLLRTGAEWALEAGYAQPQDVERTEERGRLKAADPKKVSSHAIERGISQVGTLGAGNHFIEVDVVDEIYDEEAAQVMGLAEGRVVTQIHCGSRGFGHQVCTDYLRDFQSATQKYNIQLPDRQLICAPFTSPEGQAYYAAMCAAANYAFANRQVLAHHIRQSFKDVLKNTGLDYRLTQVYDIAHNMAKVETHRVGGKDEEVIVHRKGATRAFGPGFEGLPPEYQPIGQPVLVPGSMGTASWILVGTPGSMEQTFGSTCHGAGRTMSRSKAKKTIQGDKLRKELQGEGIQVRAGSLAGLAEEAPQAYKDVDEVVRVVTGAGIARKVARVVPIAVIKG